MRKNNYIYVEKYSELKRIAMELKTIPVLGIDLEADSLFHYKEKVCILQMSTENTNYVVDTILLRDLSMLRDIFKDSAIRKVFHGADYDLRSLKRDFCIEVKGLFDTQVAARFLGSNEIGLAYLLKEKLGVILEKKYQKKDWSRRPLPEEMISYAVNDSRYLIQLSFILEKELLKLGRFSYFEEECESLTLVKFNKKMTKPMFIKFRGAGVLDRRSLAILEELLLFRDKQARRLDRPLFKVIGNGPILEIAKKKPKTLKELRSIKGLNEKLLDRFGRKLLMKVQNALDMREDELPFYPKKNQKHIGRKASERIKTLKQWRIKKASELGIDPSLIVSNSAIKPIAIKNLCTVKCLRDISEIRGWQVDKFGKEICSLIN